MNNFPFLFIHGDVCNFISNRQNQNEHGLLMLANLLVPCSVKTKHLCNLIFYFLKSVDVNPVLQCLHNFCKKMFLPRICSGSLKHRKFTHFLELSA